MNAMKFVMLRKEIVDKYRKEFKEKILEKKKEESRITPIRQNRIPFSNNSNSTGHRRLFLYLPPQFLEGVEFKLRSHMYKSMDLEIRSVIENDNKLSFLIESREGYENFSKIFTKKLDELDDLMDGYDIELAVDGAYQNYFRELDEILKKRGLTKSTYKKLKRFLENDHSNTASYEKIVFKGIFARKKVFEIYLEMFERFKKFS